MMKLLALAGALLVINACCKNNLSMIVYLKSFLEHTMKSKDRQSVSTNSVKNNNYQ